jgi:hypothetical protein
MLLHRTGSALRVLLFNIVQVVYYTLFANHLRGQRRSTVGIRSMFAFAANHNIVLKVTYLNDYDGSVHTRNVEVTDATRTHATVICRLRDRQYRCFKLENVLTVKWSGWCYIPEPASTGLTYAQRYELRKVGDLAVARF